MGMQRVLVIGAHTDDAEFGMGGTITKLVHAGVDVHVMALSNCGHSALRDEFEASMSALSVRKHMAYDMPVRLFGVMRQEILQLMVDWDRDIEPDTVFVHNSYDVHQDHAVVHAEALRAFKRRSIIGYELPWNNYIGVTNSFSVLEEKHVATKVKAMRCYKSQAHRPYANEEFLRALAITRGVGIGTKYAECFQSIRQIL